MSLFAIAVQLQALAQKLIDIDNQKGEKHEEPQLDSDSDVRDGGSVAVLDSAATTVYAPG
jgi:hypothetical protein